MLTISKKEELDELLKKSVPWYAYDEVITEYGRGNEFLYDGFHVQYGECMNSGGCSIFRFSITDLDTMSTHSFGIASSWCPEEHKEGVAYSFVSTNIMSMKKSRKCALNAAKETFKRFLDLMGVKQ